MEPRKKELMHFGIIMFVGLTLVFGMLVPYFLKNRFSYPLIFIGLAFLIPGIFFPKVLKHPFKAWMTIGHYLGIVNTKILLSIIFFTLITPMGLLFKILRKDPLNRRLGDSATYKKKSRRDIDMNHPY